MIEATSSRESYKSHSCTILFANNNQEEDRADSDDYTTTAVEEEEEAAEVRVAVAGLAVSNQKGPRVSAASRAGQPAGA